MSSLSQELLSAVQRMNAAEKEFQDSRIQVATLLDKAAKTHTVTSLAILTGIGRTTIYWMIHNWSDERNGNNHGIGNNRSAEG